MITPSALALVRLVESLVEMVFSQETGRDDNDEALSRRVPWAIEAAWRRFFQREQEESEKVANLFYIAMKECERLYNPIRNAQNTAVKQELLRQARRGTAMVVNPGGIPAVSGVGELSVLVHNNNNPVATSLAVPSSLGSTDYIYRAQ